MSKRLFLIDASNVLHRYYHAMKDRPRLNAAGQDISVVGGVLGFLERILADHQPDALAWVEDAGDSGRGKIDPNYKSARIRLDGEEKEKFRASEKLIKEVLEAMRIPTLQVPGFEADDVMATMACRVAEKGWTAVIVGHDKDMYQVVSERIHILVPGRSGKTPVPDRLVTPENAAERLGVPPHQVVDYLSLVGDGADTVPGVKGIGEKGAIELLKQFGSLSALLERVQEVSSKRYRVALENQADQARRCGDLVRLILDVPVPFGRDLRVWARDSAKFSEVCQRLGMKQKEEGIWARSRGEPAAPAKPSGARTM